MVVPYVNRLEDPVEKYLTNLDIEMSEILERQDISIDEKLALYNQALQKFMVKNSTEKIEVLQHPNDVVVEVKKEIKKENKKRTKNFDGINKFEFKPTIKPEDFLNSERSSIPNTPETPKSKKSKKINAPIIDRTRITDDEYENITRQKAKDFNIPLNGDKNWTVSGKGGVKWLSKKFF